jgi:ParB-like chromosome segregation protein Spo0J
VKRIGIREMQLARINIPDPPDLLERMTTERVRAMAASLEATNGPLHAPVVRRSDKKLIAGWDRIAACRLMKRDRVEVLLVDGTDEEMAELALVENLYRRQDDRDALTRQLVELRAARLSKQGVTKVRTAGRPKTVEAQVREQVAQERNTTPAALKQAAYRDRKKARAVEAPAGDLGSSGRAAGGDRADDPADAANLTPSPPIETFGLPLPDDLAALVTAAQAHLDKAAKLVTQAVAELNHLQNLDGYDGTKAQDLREIVRRAGAVVRESRPEAVCPWCKGEPAITCMACRGQRFATKAQMAGDVPRELLARGAAAAVTVNGRLVLLAEWRPSGEPGGAAKPPEKRGGNGPRNGASGQGGKHAS